MKKSSDNTNQPRRLEEVFRDGFEPAEVKPGAHLWNRIEQELESKQANYYKKRLAWYRSVAAASVLLLTFAMAYLWYDTQTAHRLNAPADGGGIVAQQPIPPALPQKNIPAPAVATSPVRRQPVTEPVTVAAENSKAGHRVMKRRTTETLLPAAKENIPLQSNQPETVGFGDPVTVAAASPALASETTSQATQPAANNLPADSVTSSLAMAPEQQPAGPEYPLLAAVEPTSKSQSGQAARWSLGGGTGSHYFDQNIKFKGPSGNTMGIAPAFNSSTGTAISKNNGGTTVADAMKEFNENTRSAFSYRAAIAGNYRLNNAWSVEAGLTFAENKAQTVTSYIINKPALVRNNYEYASGNFLDNNTAGKSMATNVTIPVTVFVAELTGGYLDNNNVTVDKVAPFNVYYRYRQIGVPVKLRYQYGRGNWFTFVQAGGAVNILLQTSILSDSPQVPDVEYALGQTSPFRKWYFTALGSLGRGLKVSEVWQVQGSLDVARSFSTLTLTDLHPHTNQRKPYYVGFGISSSYLIRKK